MSVAFLFPGQGAQQPYMLHSLPDHPAIVATLDEASAVLGLDVRGLDAPEALSSTVATQLALLIAGVATARALAAEVTLPDLVAGLSVGAFGAAVAAQTLDFTDALKLVYLRATLMEQAYPIGYGMAAIIGLSERQVGVLVAQVTSREAPVYVANINAPRQIVIAGADAGLDAMLALAGAAGASRAQRLHVIVPSHCPLLASVAEALSHAMAGVQLHLPRVPYISNRGARAFRSADAIREDLATNVAHPVRWHDATTAMVERGVALFLELPPGQVLTDLATAAFPGIRALALTTCSLDSAIALIQRESRSAAG
jgi:malonate decarboxylase epsilon subunit